MSTSELGKEGEAVAVQYLREIGYRIIAQNVVMGGVEADIVAQDGKETVIIEVKTKSHLGYGLPQEMVGTKKQHQLRRFVQYWVTKHHNQEVRVDVIAVHTGVTPAQIEHLQNVVEGP